MNYKRTVKWLRESFRSRDADHQLFQQLTTIKQNKRPMRTYLAKFHARVQLLDTRGVKLNALTQRKFMLDGVKEHIRAKAIEIPEYYSMPYQDLVKKLIALDEAMSKSVVVNSITHGNKSVDQLVAAALRKYGVKGSPKSNRDLNRDIRFSTKDMKSLYTEEEWKERLKMVEDKVHPSKKAHLFSKDCYPVVDGEAGKGAEKACVYCRKLGHTINECKKCK